MWVGGYPTEQDARAARRAATVEVDKGTYARPATDTLADLAPRWLASRVADGKKGSTIYAYDSDLKLYILPALGARTVGKVTAAHVEALYASLLNGRIAGARAVPDADAAEG